ncbi:hypothetical protein [Leptolyngbya sp. GGD]|uniref:hypothetical protein n=1 Tax=Leptolyngbya sp. GGD TaxID=2997907 RepID=UPI00227CF4D3|nr:hypothetical protein [Leptolyngbya sp. GGD]MCY6492317.1 hypothetical protein [Leptolyngbya sp. GGD]
MLTFIFHCEACGKSQSFYISQTSPEELQEENKWLQEMALYLDRNCESLRDRLAVAESMAAWSDPDGTPIADLLG